jgi:hypothetical protein
MGDVLCPKCGAHNPGSDYVTICQHCLSSLKGAQAAPEEAVAPAAAPAAPGPSATRAAPAAPAPTEAPPPAPGVLGAAAPPRGAEKGLAGAVENGPGKPNNSYRGTRAAKTEREENAMREFIAKFGDRIDGVLCGFDRRVFRGHLRGIS